MANTYVLIASNTLSSNATTVTFSNIPGTYTDLVLKTSIRGGRSGSTQVLYMQYNGATNGVYSSTWVKGNGTAASSSSTGANSTYFDLGTIPATSETSNTFSNGEIYIPNYTSSVNKPISSFNAGENNATFAEIYSTANLGRNTNAITSITILNNGNNFVTGSSFWLYGIKKD